MSRYLGKVFLEGLGIGSDPVKSASVRYVRSFGSESGSGSGFGGYMLRIRMRDGSRVSARIGEPACVSEASIRGGLECQYEWSVGYSVRKKRQGSEPGALREMLIGELDAIGGRRELLGSGQIPDEDSYLWVSAVHELFRWSPRELAKARGAYPGWVPLERRKPSLDGGRKRIAETGGSSLSESIDEVLVRCSHNRKAAVAKGRLDWWLEAAREEAKALGLGMGPGWEKEQKKAFSVARGQNAG